MALTRDSKETVKERAARDPAFAKAMLDEAATAFLNGEPHVARLILRDLVNASIGFEELATETNRPSKSLHRMLAEKGNPSMDNLAAIFSAVRRRLGVIFEAPCCRSGRTPGGPHSGGTFAVGSRCGTVSGFVPRDHAPQRVLCRSVLERRGVRDIFGMLSPVIVAVIVEGAAFMHRLLARFLAEHVIAVGRSDIVERVPIVGIAGRSGRGVAN